MREYTLEMVLQDDGFEDPIRELWSCITWHWDASNE